jgi:hypothetical protein
MLTDFAVAFHRFDTQITAELNFSMPSAPLAALRTCGIVAFTAGILGTIADGGR